MRPLRVLLVEDSADDALFVLEELRRGGFAPAHERVDTAAALTAALAKPGWDLVISDFSMPHFSGLQALALFKKQGLDVPFIVVSGNIGEDIAVETMRAGANDYVMKQNLARLVSAVDRELGESEQRRQRRRAERALLESEERHRTILQTAMDGFWLMDTEGRLLEVNDAYCRLSGYSASELLALRVSDLEADETPEQIAASIQKVKAQGECRFESRHRRKDGSIIDVEISVQYQLVAGGQFAVFLHDITERKRAAEQLRVFALAVENSSDAIGMSTPEGKHYYQNKAFDDLFGAIGENPPATVFVDEQVGREVFRTIMGGNPWDGEAKMRGKAGELLDVFERAYAIKDDTGRILGLVGVHTNITERKRAEEALRVKQWAIESAASAMAMSDLKGNLNYVNPAFLKLWGYGSLAEVAGKAAVEFWQAGDQATEVIEKLRARGSWSGDMVAKRKNGNSFDVQVVASMVMDAAGQPIYMQAWFSDITERKRAEEERSKLAAQLRQAQKMEAVGQLAGGVAHDFNNLLFVINGRAELAMSKLEANDPLRAQLELIHETGVRAANLTRQLLAFSRRQILQPKILDLNALVTDMSKMLSRLIREDISMKMVLCPALRVTKADPGQVEQVLMNLVVNARDAMPENGTLTIETANVELDEAYCRTHADAKPGRYVMLAISDTGCGMDDDVKAHIFEPFFTTKEQGKGTGLGLATVYGIVRQSAGHIGVYSEVGKGTTFKIYLPETAATPARDSHTIKTIVPRGTETILLVEDEEEVRALASEILESNGYTVLLTGNGTEALSVCKKRKGKIGLIITDVVMPKMNGPEMVEKARSLCPGIKVLFMSGYSDGAVSSNGVLSAGANYLQKPFTPGTLARKVREVLDSTAETTPAGRDD